MSNQIALAENYSSFKGEIEYEIKDTRGRVLYRYNEPNLIKIFAKEQLAHRIVHDKVWDPSGSAGSGEWVDSGIDPNNEMAAKYILLGASFDEDGLPLSDADERFYKVDPATGVSVPRRPDVGASDEGDLINPIPISEPLRPLKKIESIYFEPSYQPPDSPLLQSNVRAMNNVVVMETTIRQEEYNGFGTTNSDFFTITEIALAGGAVLDSDIGACECEPKRLFLQGVDAAKDEQIIATANGTPTVTIDPSVSTSDVNRIVEGDQIFLVGRADTDESYDTIGQVNPYYLVTTKAVGGRDVTLDRTPVDSDGNPIEGSIGIYRTTLRLFSHRILAIPFKKSEDFVITIRWRINFN